MKARRPDHPIQIPSGVRGGAVHLGLDFGTHSTKAVLRVRGDRRPAVLFLDGPAAGYPAFASPSLVRLTDGRLYFGEAALGENGGELFRSLKVSLLPPSAHDPRPPTLPAGVRPEVLVALYLAWLMGRIRGALGDVSETRFTMNVAAPMNHLEDVGLRDRYLRVVHAAWRAAFDPAVVIQQGVALASVRERIEVSLGRPVPDSGVRRFAVLAETLAPLVSLSREPSFRPGFYLMVDMGAGTTELSVSYLKAYSADQCIWCCADRSHPLGADLFHSNDRRNAASSDAHEGEELLLEKRLLDCFKRVWYEGFKKDKDFTRASREQWGHLDVRLAGGGLRRPPLAKLIEDNPPQDPFFVKQRSFKEKPRRYWVDWHCPADLDLGAPLSGDSTDASPSSAAYLAVADGLAVERGLWPKFKYPADVSPLGHGGQARDPWERSYSDSDVG